MQDDFSREILSRFTNDEIGELCKSEPKLIVIGKRLYQKGRRKVDKQMEHRKSVMCDMRLLSRLFIEFKEQFSYKD